MTRIKIKTIANHKKIMKPKFEKHSGYAMQWWRDYSIQLRSTNPKCYDCEREFYDIKNLVTDHVIPVELGGSFEDKRNHRVRCVWCHNKKTSQEKNKPLYLYIQNESGKFIPQLDKEGKLIKRK